MRTQRNSLVGTSQDKAATAPQASKGACEDATAGWRYMLARPFIPAGPASAVAMTPLLTRETAA
ncbi:MAG TPA: hypothetical protein VF063_03115 [Gaiellaceae bacterium]